MPMSDKERQQFFYPRKPGEKVAALKDKFAFLNEYVRARGGWVTSLPGAAEVTIETLTGSTLPNELRSGGAKVKIGEGRNERSMILPPYNVLPLKEDDAERGERILPHGITTMTLLEGSSSPIPVQHAGIVTVLRYSFAL